MVVNALRIERLLSLILLRVIDSAGDEQPVRLDANLKVFLREARYFCGYEQFFFGLSDFHWNMQSLLLHIQRFERTISIEELVPSIEVTLGFEREHLWPCRGRESDFPRRNGYLSFHNYTSY